MKDLYIVIDGEPSPQANDHFRQRVLLQAPAGHVHLVHALVADVAVAVVPEPVPVVVEPVRVEGAQRRRAEPGRSLIRRRRRA